MVILILSSVVGSTRPVDRTRGTSFPRREISLPEAPANPSYESILSRPASVELRIYRLVRQRDRFLMVFGASPLVNLLGHINPFAAITVKGSLIIRGATRWFECLKHREIRGRTVGDQILFQSTTGIIEDLMIARI